MGVAATVLRDGARDLDPAALDQALERPVGFEQQLAMGTDARRDCFQTCALP